MRFVGLDAYEAAGGGTRRDLFAEADSGVYLTDATLLERLAQDKLASLAAEAKAEGWAWADATPSTTHADLQAFQRAPRQRRSPNKREAQPAEATQQTAQAVAADEEAEAPEAVAALANEQPQAEALAA